MAADIPSLKADYRLAATQLASTPKALADQKVWLLAEFMAEMSGGTAEVTNASMDGRTSSFQFRGSTSEDRRRALRAAIEDITAEIAADAAGNHPPAAPAVLIPRVLSAPR